MMRKYTLIIIAIYLSLQAYGQRTFSLTVDHEIKGNLLLLRLYVQKDAGEDIALGTSNIALTLNNDNLDLSRKFKIDSLSSSFDAKIDPESYYPITLGGDNIVNLTIVVNTNGKGTGRKISQKRMLIAGVAVPIKNRCGKANISWIKDKVALCVYSKKAKPASIKDKANFINPIDFSLHEPLTVPLITEGSDRKLSVNYEGKKQWYFNDNAIAGASSNTYSPVKNGTYNVKIFNECGESTISEDYQLLITSSKAQTEQQIAIDVFPNPFIDGFHVRLYAPVSEKARVKVFDAIGNQIFDHFYQLNSIGEYDLNISISDQHLSPGFYFAEVQLGGVTKTIRLVKLNS